MEDAGGEGTRGLLGGLIELERRIDSEISEAEAEAERIVDAARREVESGQGAARGESAPELDSLRESIEAEIADSLRSIEARASLEVERYESVDDAGVRSLAGWLADRIAGGGSGG